MISMVQSHGVSRRIGRDRRGKIAMLIFFVAPFHHLDEYQGNVEDFAVM
jgi:hypothetical protein